MVLYRRLSTGGVAHATQTPTVGKSCTTRESTSNPALQGIKM